MHDQPCSRPARLARAAPAFGLALLAVVAGSAAPRLAAQTAAPAPLGVKIGAATFTPGGFLDLTAVYRDTNVGSGIGTAFGSIPFAGTPAGELSEFRFSAQNSRVALKIDAHPGDEAVTGYLEADFLGNAPGNLVVGSNSDTLRMRLYWVDVRRGSWEVLAGQSWSLLTPNRKGLSPLPGDVFYTQDMDTNYQVGLTWSRDPQVRFVDHINDHWTAGLSLENPEQYILGAATVALPPGYAGQFSVGSSSSTPNPAPDIVAKAAYDSGGRRPWHAELAGLERNFRDAAPAGSRHSAVGAGVSLNGNVELFPGLDLLANSFFSDGGGRYIFGLGPDLIVRSDGTISPVHSSSGILGFEEHLAPAWLLFGYYGGAYFQRNYQVAAGGDLGFGFPGAGGGVNRAIQEATLGVTHTFWSGAAGSLALITQLSYLTRSPWSVAAGSPTSAKSNMGWVDVRYTLP